MSEPQLRSGRAIVGMAAVLLPFRGGTPDWVAYAGLLDRVVAAGLSPAVNMDTGFVDLIDEATRARVLEIAADHAPAGFVAGAFVGDTPGSPFDHAGYAHAVGAIAGAGGTPVVFPSYGLSALPEEAAIAAHARLGNECDSFIAFELAEAFSPAGRVYSLDAWGGLLDIPQCVGAKHSSLRRAPEWERLELRDRRRPDFLVLTGNDLAIDMVMWGSDYLLGLASFAPEAFARRDQCWSKGDAAFYELNDALQALGAFAFRPPVPAYRSSAAQFLHLQGLVGPDAAHPACPRRPASDVDVLHTIRDRIEGL